MANTTSARKAQRQTVRRTLRNRSTRSAVKTFLKKATAAVSDRDAAAVEAVRLAVRALDKAAQKGIIHRNNAARHKSRLMSRLHALSVAPEPVAAAPTATPATRTRRPAAGRSPSGTRKAATTPTRPSAGATT